MNASAGRGSTETSKHMNQARATALAVLVAACAVAPSLAAQERLPVGEAHGDTLRLTLGEAQRRALTRNPAFLADATEREIALGALRAARVYSFNPEAELEALGSASTGGLGRYEATLSQEVEWAGQRGLRIDAAEIGVARAERSVANAARRTLADVSTAFYAALAAERRLVVTTELLGLNERLLQAVRTQVREGEISVMEANLGEIEVGRARARVLSARRAATSARLELGRLVGIAPSEELRVEPEVPAAPPVEALDPEALMAAALERRPDLAAASTAVRQAETLTRLARREAIPNLRIAALAEREGTGGEPRIGIGVGLPLPLWDRNQGLIARRRALSKQAALTLEATALRVRTEVIDAYRSYVAATQEARVFEEDVLEPARTNQDLLETAYQAGKIDLAALVLLRNQLLDAHLSYWDAWLAQREALVGLQAATGQLITEESNEDDR